MIASGIFYGRVLIPVDYIECAGIIQLDVPGQIWNARLSLIDANLPK
jgi:hypothetical protein